MTTLMQTCLSANSFLLTYVEQQLFKLSLLWRSNVETNFDWFDFKVLSLLLLEQSSKNFLVNTNANYIPCRPLGNTLLQYPLQPSSQAFSKTFNFSRVFQIAYLGCAAALFQASIKYHCGPMKWLYGAPYHCSFLIAPSTSVSFIQENTGTRGRKEKWMKQYWGPGAKESWHLSNFSRQMCKDTVMQDFVQQMNSRILFGFHLALLVLLKQLFSLTLTLNFSSWKGLDQ